MKFCSQLRVHCDHFRLIGICVVLLSLGSRPDPCLSSLCFKVIVSELGAFVPFRNQNNYVSNVLTYFILLMRQFSEGGLSTLVRAQLRGIHAVSIDSWNGSVQTLTILFLKRGIFSFPFPGEKTTSYLPPHSWHPYYIGALLIIDLKELTVFMMFLWTLWASG